MKDFAVYILSHARANTQATEKSLRKAGYTGEIVFVVDDLDLERPIYEANFGEQVSVFDKRAYADRSDSGKNKSGLAAVLYARNAAYDIARERGHRWFVEMDDDFTGFATRIGKGNGTEERDIKTMDAWLGAYLEFFKRSGVALLGIGTQGDYIGGKSSRACKYGVKPTASGVMFCDTENRVRFVSSRNEDMSSDLLAWRGGQIVMSVLPMYFKTKLGKGAGGMRETYATMSQYEMFMQPILWCPSSMKLKIVKGGGMFQSVEKEYALPKIIREDKKK